MPSQQRKNKQNPYAATTWGVELIRDIEVPSGQLCQVRMPGVQGLIKAGLLDSLDSLTSLVQTEHIDRVEKGHATTVTPEQMQALAGNVEKLEAALSLMDKVVAHIVIQPSVKVPPENDADRVPGQVYADSIELMDKVYLFQLVVGGVHDLETFRKEFGETVGSMEALTGVSSSGK